MSIISSPIRDEDGREGFVFLQHDAEWSLQSVNADRIGPYNVGGPGDFDQFNPQYLFQVLTANAEFRQTFADMVQAEFYWRWRHDECEYAGAL